MATEEKKEGWLNYLAITTVLVAVCATLSTFKGGGYSTKSLLSQSNAADEWAFYQSKSIKSYLYEIQKDNVQMDIDKLTADQSKADISLYKKKLSDYEGKIKKYEKEKEEISKKAKGFEDIRDDAKKHSQQFGIAVIFLQISILLSSIAALAKRKYVWYFSIIAGCLGFFYFLDGFFLFLL
jgi:hypothetical protein